MNFDLTFALSILPSLARASILALVIGLASTVVACLLGFLLELARRSRPYLRYLITLFIDLVRIIPIIVLLYFVYFVLPYWGIVIAPLVIGVGCLGVHYSSYLAEVFKAGIDAIPRGQREAGIALGLHPWQVNLLVILPLMLRNSIPAMTNYFLSILKATPYLSLIAIDELLGTAFTFASDTFRYYEPFAILGVFFLAYSLIIAALSRQLELYFMQKMGQPAPR